ncbi:MAG: STM4011 family radical SAM protein [Candidatus Melainabacteria bacterium]|nr:STM4011 family radical SAM protein [Candidatus Melainabacteria bacterium]
MRLSIIYRGPLSSCNYGCEYCPFAKHHETDEEHARDTQQLSRFVDWANTRKQHQLSVLFTPWGEALIRPRYQDAISTLTKSDTIEKVAIQTNLSCRLEWVENCDKSKLALWATFHPTETTRQKFLAKCLELVSRGVRFSVGAVGLKEHFDEILALRDELPDSVYFWINAYKRIESYYTDADIELLTKIDPLFPMNNEYHPSLGKACRAGSSVISVDGDGQIKRCHFISEKIGNIYDEEFESALSESPCSNAVCGCHIGYVHMDELRLYDVFSGGILERVPADWSPVSRLTV